MSDLLVVACTFFFPLRLFVSGFGIKVHLQLVFKWKHLCRMSLKRRRETLLKFEFLFENITGRPSEQNHERILIEELSMGEVAVKFVPQLPNGKSTQHRLLFYQRVQQEAEGKTNTL